MAEDLVPKKTLLTQLNTICVLSLRMLALTQKYNELRRKQRLESIRNASDRLGKARK